MGNPQLAVGKIHCQDLLRFASDLTARVLTYKIPECQVTLPHKAKAGPDTTVTGTISPTKSTADVLVCRRGRIAGILPYGIHGAPPLAGVKNLLFNPGQYCYLAAL